MPTGIMQVPFLGVDEGRDPKTCPPGTLLVGENCAMDKQRRIVKRFGTKALSKTGGPSTGKRLIQRDQELCVTDGSSLFSYQAATNTWMNQGQVPECGLTWTTLQDPIDGAMWNDICLVGNNELVHAWVTGDPTNASNAGNLWFEVLDRTTGERLTQPTLADSSGTIGYGRLVSDGVNWVLLWNVSTNVKCVVNGAAAVTLRSDAATANTFDACTIGSNFAIAYNSNHAAQLAVFSYSFASPPVQQATADIATQAHLRTIGMDARLGETLYVIYSDETASVVKVIGVDASSFANTFAAVTLDSTASMTMQATTVSRYDATHAAVAYSMSTSGAGTAYSEGMTVTSIVSSAGAVANGRKNIAVSIISRPFMLNGVMYMFVGDAGWSPAFASYGGTGGNPGAGSINPAWPGTNTYLIEVPNSSATTGYPCRYVGLVDVLIGGQWRVGGVANVPIVSATEALACLPFQGEAPRAATKWRQGCRLVDVTIGASVPTDTWGYEDLGGEAYIVGATYTAYDGRRPFDFGFSRPPFIDKLFTSMTGGGGSLAVGNYIYSAVSVFRSMVGAQHRSPTAPPWTVTAVANDTANLKIVPQTLHWKGTNASSSAATEALRVFHVVYRTQVNGSTLQRLSQLPVTNTIANNPAAIANGLTDTNSDISIPLAPQPAMYNVAELDDYPPPASVTQAKYRNRLVVVDGSKRQVWISKDYSANPGTAPGFHPTQLLVFTEDLVGLDVLDDKLIFFSALGIWTVAGDGPAPNGTGSDYGTPIRLQTDSGCSNARSIVSTDQGVYFLSSRGIMMLDRGMTADWVGRPIMDTLAAYPNITSAVAVPAQHEARFTANKADGSAGVVIVHDYVANMWFTRKYKDVADTGNVSMPIADACITPAGVYTMLTPTGQVYQEDTTTKLDAGTSFVTRDVQLAWIAPQGPVSWQRVKNMSLLGTNVTNYDAEVSLRHDYATTYDDVRTFAAGTSGTAIGPLEKFRVDFKVQKVQAVSVRLRDLTPSTGSIGTGDGPIWEGLAIQVMSKEGLPRTAAAAEG